MDSLISVFTDYIGRYLFYILLCISIGYVFIRIKEIGYLFSALFICTSAFFVYAVRYKESSGLSDLEQIVFIFFGTLIGGWRYLFGNYGLPFGIPSFNLFGRFNDYRDTRRFRKTYAEELAREAAKKHAWGADNAGTHNNTGTHRRTEQSSEHDKTRERKERYKRTREEAQEETNRSSSQNNYTSVESDWDILGIPEGSTKEEIQRAYRKQSNRVHPDKMPDSIRGDSDLEKAYNDKFVKVNKAYERLMKRA